ncbi:Uncharacterised protein [Candidatus Burarchaeum australiense]|nr:Uncharacterised protein [Candidatus Burarchaeum australiense]
MNVRITGANISAGAPKGPAQQNMKTPAHPETGFFGGLHGNFSDNLFLKSLLLGTGIAVTLNSIACSRTMKNTDKNTPQPGISDASLLQHSQSEFPPWQAGPMNLLSYRDTGMTIWNYARGADGSITWNPCVSGKILNSGQKPIQITKIEVTINGQTEVSEAMPNERLIMPNESMMLSMKGAKTNGYVPFGAERRVTVTLTYVEILPNQPSEPKGTITTSLPYIETDTITCLLADWGNKPMVRQYAMEVPVSEVLATPQLLMALFGNSQRAAIKLASEHNLLVNDADLTNIVNSMRSSTRNRDADELTRAFESRIRYLANTASLGPETRMVYSPNEEVPSIRPGLVGLNGLELAGSACIVADGPVRNWTQHRRMELTLRNTSRTTMPLRWIWFNDIPTDLGGNGGAIPAHGTKQFVVGLSPITASRGNEEMISVKVRLTDGTLMTGTLNLTDANSSGPLQGMWYGLPF